MGKRFLVASGLVLLLFLVYGGVAGQGAGPVGATIPSGREFTPDELLVRF